MLRPYAMRDEETQGRRFPEASHPYRSGYERDRDRVVHTKAFRRLEHKTQVFDPAYCDHFRNRLTHTIEVSQIARTVSGALGLNGALCEALALSHDIGHPPFSHEGEKVLDELMRGFGSGFDHNLHALRIVEDFEERYASFRGLNLTFEVREGIVKHSRDYEEGETAYIDIREYRLGERPPLEAQLIDLTDEIAYNTADLDDGYDSGLLPLERILDEVPLFRGRYDGVRRAYPEAPEKLQVSETVRAVIDVLVTGLIESTREELVRHRIQSAQEVRQFPRRLLCFGGTIAQENHRLKEFLRQNLYSHEVLRRDRERARRMVRGLFEYYLEEPDSLPTSHYARLDGLERHRVVCDYIAGMTDKFAQARYAKIFWGDASSSEAGKRQG